MSFLRKIFGSRNERYIKSLQPLVARIGEFEGKFKELSDTDLRSQTPRLRERLSKGETLDALLPEAFATAREASRRVLGMRHFDEQLMGGMVLHQGKISEMKTGEGKTLVATLPVYLNALPGKGVHVVTVNDYLARRDAEWMGQLYRFLGLEVGVIAHGISDAERKKSYAADVTYGQNNEFGFDYLRDNMKYRLEDCVQRPLHYAIVDEVDSILIDEARTPLIISGPAEESTDKYYQINQIIPRLKKDADYTIDEKARSAQLTDEGVEHVESLLGVPNLYDPSHIETVHHVNQGLRAHTLYNRDVDYVVKDGEVIIVDEFTGRLMPGRRWSDGLHQAVEAKEGVTIERENQTLATITFQNYFRLYEKLAGMTGTADTEATEFAQIYNLEVIVVPTHRPMIRDDTADVVYKTEREKYEAALAAIREKHESGQPVLVGTISIEKSEVLAQMLRKAGVPHNVLNAKQHEREAEIIAQAGRSGAVTISTNMAGRGTDIVLGGNPELLARSLSGATEGPEYEEALARYKTACEEDRKKVLEAGGLHVLGTERHESRRIDNQLRGRSGRQGDPGSSKFYLSLEDELLRIFGGDRIKGLMERLGMEEGEPIEHPWLTRAIENAQRRVEARNFDIRKHLLEYDAVMNEQRKVIYGERRAILEGKDFSQKIQEFIGEVLEETMLAHCDERGYVDDWDLQGLNEALKANFAFEAAYHPAKIGDKNFDEFFEIVREDLRGLYHQRQQELGAETLKRVETWRYLVNLDNLWKDHLHAMDDLKEGIGLRGYAQQDPKQIYKKEAFELFGGTIATVKVNTVRDIFHVRLRQESEIDAEERKRREAVRRLNLVHGEAGGKSEPAKPKPQRRPQVKVGRNDPCWCGSGKKYKKCHGRESAEGGQEGDSAAEA
ncbi:MAG: preprotein translocase subunit SecA [Bdellovibrionota bacterium]